MIIITELILLPFVGMCGIIDCKKYIIPNKITFPLLLIGFVYQIYLMNWKSILLSLVIGFFLLLLAMATGGIGGGDIKLITAIYLWLPAYNATMVMMIASIIGLIWVIIKKTMVTNFTKTKEEYYKKAIMLQSLGIRGIEKKDYSEDKTDVVPFGTCIAIGLTIFMIFNFSQKGWVF